MLKLFLSCILSQVYLSNMMIIFLSLTINHYSNMILCVYLFATDQKFALLYIERAHGMMCNLSIASNGGETRRSEKCPTAT
jgi:hypothetical protein